MNGQSRAQATSRCLGQPPPHEEDSPLHTQVHIIDCAFAAMLEVAPPCALPLAFRVRDYAPGSLKWCRAVVRAVTDPAVALVLGAMAQHVPTFAPYQLYAHACSLLSCHQCMAQLVRSQLVRAR